MQYKTSLHIHSREDLMDGKIIDYTIYDLIDFADSKGFRILAFTPHEYFVFEEKWKNYAREKGILLIPGIELNIEKKGIFGNHILVLNCDKKAEEIKSFEDLRIYKNNNPETLIIAPHPGFDKINSISLKKLEENIDLFDVIEHSWFYTSFRNKNLRVEKIARKYSKPIIATSDTHFLDFFDTDYTIIDSEKLEIEEIFTNIKKWNFTNYTIPKRLYDLVRILFKMVWRNWVR